MKTKPQLEAQLELLDILISHQKLLITYTIEHINDIKEDPKKSKGDKDAELLIAEAHYTICQSTIKDYQDVYQAISNQIHVLNLLESK